MFVDQADIQVRAGDGGRGCVSFRKEKYIPQGGPDGGDGGDGGSVYIEAVHGIDTLLDMVGRHHWSAEEGAMGKGKKQAGKDGGDLTIRVPPGTLIYDRTSALLIADLKTHGQKVCIAKGGKGGKGNINFVNSVRQAPDFSEPGRKGQIRELHLELRLIADVGLVGLPNAGKSTLLSRFTHARPKIADYPFTTLSPQLGIAELDAERRLVIADIPGLIEGLSDGAGLGLDFLRHVERTRVLVHIIDILPIDGSSPIEAYKQIRKELEAYSPKLAAKHEFIAANKMDLAGASEALADLRSELPGKQIFALSAVAGTGLRPLLEQLWLQVDREEIPDPLIEERPYIPPVEEKNRPEDEMFQYVEGEADEEAWEAVDEDEQELKPERSGFINAAGEELESPPSKKSKKANKVRRTTIDPVVTTQRGKGGPRITAKDRKAAHASRVKKKVEALKGTTQPAIIAPEPQPEKITPTKPTIQTKFTKQTKSTKVIPLTDDEELAAEVEAMKADDVRKGKFYNRKRSDI